jgi:hypothetical protein
MRSTLLSLAAGLSLLTAGVAAAQTAPPTTAPLSSGPSSSDSAPASATTAPPSDSGSADAAASAGANTSATAGGFTVGEPVKDNAGVTIGSISSLSPAANSGMMAVIKMGSDTFQVQTDRLASDNGAAIINLTQAQISGMLHGGASAGASSPK